MWNPPSALSPEEQKIAVRTQKARKFFVFLRTIRHELLDADFQQRLAKSYSPEPGGKAPVEAGVLALATLFHFRLRLIAHNLDKTLLDRTVALAEQTGGFGARQLRAALDSTPLFGAGRVEDTLNLLGHALRKAVGLAAQELDTSAEAILVDAGLVLVGQRSLKAALDLDWGQPKAREQALRLVLDEVERWKI